MNKESICTAGLIGKLSGLRIGQRLVICMMIMITILVLPIILVMTQALRHQETYNRVLENLGNISYIIQETEGQGYRILDYCTMDINIEQSGETEIIVQMLDKAEKIRENIGEDARYQENLDRLQIVENLLKNYAESYKSGAGKCGDTFSMAGDTDFYSMTDTAKYIVNNCNKLQSLEINRSEDLKEEISRNFCTMLVSVLVILVVVILLMVQFVYAITRSITYPLGLLMSHIAEISKSGLLDEDSENTTEMAESTSGRSMQQGGIV